MKKIAALIMFLAPVLAGTARADLVNVDLGGGPVFTGTGVAGGGLWNNVFGVGASGALLNSAGTASPVTFTIGSSSGTVNTTGGTNPATNPATAALFQDYTASAFNNNLFLTISGLTPLQTYDLTIYAAGSTTGEGSIFSANFPGTTTAADRLAFVAGDNYLEHSIAADGSGMIAVSAAGRNGSDAVFNGFQIGTIPEPSTYALALGGLGLLLFAQRSRRRTV